MRCSSARLGIAAALLLVTGACSGAGDRAAGDAARGPVAGNEGERLAAVVGDYFETYLAQNPLFATQIGDHRFDDRIADSLSERWLADAFALEQDSLEAARNIDAKALPEEDRLTLELFIYGRIAAIEAAKFPDELLPLHQMGSLPTFFAQLGSGAGAQPFATEEDYAEFESRVGDFVRYCEQAIVNMRRGIEKGIVQPRIVVEKTIPQMTAHVVEMPEESVFFQPVRDFPESVSEDARARIEAAYRDAITKRLVPTYRALARFLEEEYLPAARDRIGMAALPNGRAWYDSRVRFFTTTGASADEIHGMGVAEVERIRAEMDTIRAAVGFKGDLPLFLEHVKSAPELRFETREGLLEAYETLRPSIEAELPRLFSLRPQTDFEIRAVEGFREQSAAPASYLPGSPDGSRPAIFYVNTFDPPSRPRYMVESIYLHEAVPGHHYQIALQQEMQALPAFRRYDNVTAYTEGWGLYAESLGPELGRYADPYTRFGALTAEMLRAVRLVVDTGIHAQGWSRDQALQYMAAHTALAAGEIAAEVDRYLAIPGQALAYKTGQMKIRELRRRAEHRLGAGFDVRAFHDAILADGSMPLAILEAKLERWIDEKARQAADRQAPADQIAPQPSASSS